MGPEYTPPPGSVAQPAADAPSFGAAKSGAGQVNPWTSNDQSQRPLLDLVHPKGPGALELSRELAAQAAAKQSAAQAQAGGPAVASQDGAAKRKRWPMVVAGLVVVLLLGGGAAAYVVFKPAAKVASKATPSPTPSPTPSATPSPTPSATPSPSPSSTPVLTVTAPTVAPTVSHPQAVTITSPSGLWLRSSATSIDRSNIIGWMPKGAVVSVDSTGDFWWHGTYKGQTGYFASKYTQ